MEAVAPLSSDRELDDFDFDFDIDAEGALELDCVPSFGGREEPSSFALVNAPPARMTPSPMPRMTPGPMLPPAPPWPMAAPGVRRSSSTQAAVDPHSALVAFAGFGDPPTSIFGAPSYALRVILRRRALRRDLERARRRKSADVGLYEASLRAADDGAIRSGLILITIIPILLMMLAFAATRVLNGAHHIHW